MKAAQKTIRLLFLPAVVFMFFAACGAKPEAKSGGDAYRNEAKPLELDKWEDDTVNRSIGDTTDWRSIDVGQSGKLKVGLSADKDASVSVMLFDKYGAPLGQVLKKSGSDKAVSLGSAVKADGLYFIRIQARSGGAISYSVRATLGEGGGQRGTPLPDF
jgi:hypothetical protein